MKHGLRWIWVLLAVALSACNSPSKDDVPAAVPGTYTYNFTLTASPTNMPVASKVVFVSSPTDAFCANIAGPFHQDFVGTVATAGTVQIVATVFRSTYFWDSIYLDLNSNGKLDSGDLVWGSDPSQIAGYCTRPAGDSNATGALVWEDAGNNDLGGVQTYAGATQTY